MNVYENFYELENFYYDDGQGFWLCQKRLSKGRFRWWPDRSDENSRTLAVHELQLLIWNGNPGEAEVALLWKKVRMSE